jgi:hypothetical protein
MLLLTAPSVSIYGSDAKGSIRFGECNPMRWYRLTLTQFQNEKLKKTIDLELPNDWVLQHMTKEWLQVSGMECVEEKSCVGVIGKIQNVHFHGWREMTGITGNFIIEFVDGSKIEGSFNAKYIKPPTTIICE